MRKNTQTNRGFTIVELLIVIVVIAILAAISLVAYNGIQNRANDAAVQNDLSNYAKKAQLFNVSNGQYPNSTVDLDTLDLKASQGSYDTSANNLYYCRRYPGTADVFIFMAKSKSGNIFYASSNGSGKTNVAFNAAEACNLIGLTYSTDGGANVGYSGSGSSWAGWTQ